MSTDNKENTTNATGPQPSQTASSPSADGGSGAQELAAAVDDLLDQLQHKFDKVSTEIFGKLDDMARRLDELEASLTAVQEEAAAAAKS
ncbi:hypothetical protein VTN77DRAFT_3756 [Rasamsonia byssochlamydoides]|uniref:uncharacterized protein n=1 Tax=Rasamsonia byssochlamydoides TaxID=89139 RepID=UPI0037434EFA